MAANKDSALSDLTFVSFDVETTGLDPQVDRIVEIGAARFGRDGIRAEYQQLIDPECPIPPDVVAIHGITSEMVATSPPISRVLPHIVEFFADSILIAHNAPFDIGFFDAAFARSGIALPNNQIFCTLRFARVMFPGLPGHSLEALVKELTLPAGKNHRALADAAYAAAVFRQCVERTRTAWDTTITDLERYHGPPHFFGKAQNSGSSAQTLALIEQAIEEGSTVRIDYCSTAGKITTRTIGPQSIDERGAHPKVVAFCHLRGEHRTFRLDCIKKIEPSR